MYNIGDYVKITNTNLIGYITKIKNNNNNLNYLVNINDKTVIISENNIEATNKQNIFEKNKKMYNVKLISESKLNDTIMLRHQTVDEALYNLEKFIDNAICNNISQPPCTKVQGLDCD